MRYYRPDGTYHDHPLDTEFGWFFDDISIDEATPTFQEQNDNIKEISRLHRSLSGKYSGNGSRSNDLDGASGANEVEESIDVLENMDYFSRPSPFNMISQEPIEIFESKPEPTVINKFEPNIKEETPTKSIILEHSIEGFIENPEANFYKLVKNCKIPTKEAMMALINPVNPESRALLSVISYSKYRGLSDKETNEDVLKAINFKSTNPKHLINDRDYDENVNFLLGEGKIPAINFLLNDSEIDVDQQLISEIRNYHATKEDNMLSLMMELINTDMDSNLGDMSELNNSLSELNNIGTGVLETSDLGNSIQSSIISKEGNGLRERGAKRHYLDIPNRSDILNSIGLSDDIDKSIESFVQEKMEMHQQLIDIKKSFEADEKKLDSLMDQAAVLQNDLRETTYLDNLINLLNGDLEKVKNKKLPFRIFYQWIDDAEANENLII